MIEWSTLCCHASYPACPIRNVWILQELESLLDANASALQAELGAPFRCVHDDPGSGQRWSIGPQRYNHPALGRLGYPPATEPVLHVDRAAALIASDAPVVHSLSESFSLLKQLHWDERPQLASRYCASLEEAVTKVVREVGRTWPSFSRLGLAWRDVCARHIPGVLSTRAPIPALQAWLAELAAGHTRLRGTTPEYPTSFSARIIGERLVSYQVPDGCPAWTAATACAAST